MFSACDQPFLGMRLFVNLECSLTCIWSCLLRCFSWWQLCLCPSSSPHSDRMHTAGSEHRQQLQPVRGCVVTACPLLGRSRTSLPKPASHLKLVAPFFSRLQFDPNNSSFPFILPNPSTFPSLISIKFMPSLCLFLCLSLKLIIICLSGTGCTPTKLHPIPRRRSFLFFQ